jgi:DNA-binding IclR family transcriptional regulator
MRSARADRSADTFLLGDNGPAFTSACGKILVGANSMRPSWPEYAPGTAEEVVSPHATLDPQRFFAELRAARVNGVAWSLRERDVRLCSVAAPIRVGDEPWNRAVGLAIPYSEWTVRDRDELAGQAKTLADEIAQLLQGGSPSTATAARTIITKNQSTSQETPVWRWLASRSDFVVLDL